MLGRIITISPDIQSGAPVFANTRVPIKILLDYLKAGDSIEEFLGECSLNCVQSLKIN